jgi:hypothetical protein
VAIYKKKCSIAGLGTLSLAAVIIAVTFVITLDIVMQAAGTAATTTPPNAATNNNSNPLLGNSPFMIVKFRTASINPINQTYIETSTVNDVTIILPNSTTIARTTINATETANATINILPNGVALDHGQSLIVTKGDNGSAPENATTAFVDISRMNADGIGSGTGVVFFTTNSTGQLAFLNTMLGISQSEFSPEGGTIRTWKWNGGMLPFDTIDAATSGMENHTTRVTGMPQEQKSQLQ